MYIYVLIFSQQQALQSPGQVDSDPLRLRVLSLRGYTHPNPLTPAAPPPLPRDVRIEEVVAR